MRKFIPLFFILTLIFVFPACPPPHPQTVQVEVCATSGLLPVEWCPAKEVRTFTVGQQPTTPCQVHKGVKVCAETGRRAVICCPDVIEIAEAAAPDFYCRRHARTKQVGPYLVLADLGVQCKVDRYSDEELDTYARRIGEAGVDYVRTYYPSGDDGLPSVFPYERDPDGRWNLDKANPQYDVNLRRFAVALSKYEVGVYVDMADQCGELEWTSCWRQNVNGVWGWHDESDLALIYWKTAVDRVTADIGGPAGNVIGLGNELQHPADGDLVGSCVWALKWAGRRVDYLVSLGYSRPIPMSGAGNAIHKVIGCVSAEDNYYSDYRWTTQILHGIGIETHRPDNTDLSPWLAGLSVTRSFGYSDDGADCSDWNHIPEGKRGTGNKAGNCYGASVEEKIKVIKLFARYLLPEGRFHSIEFLPRELSDDQPLSALTDESLEAFWRIGIEVFAVDPRRTFKE